MRRRPDGYRPSKSPYTHLFSERSDPRSRRPAPEPAAISSGSWRGTGPDASPADSGSCGVALGGRHRISPGRIHPAPTARTTAGYEWVAGRGASTLRDRAESDEAGELGANFIYGAAWCGDSASRTLYSIEVAHTQRPSTCKRYLTHPRAGCCGSRVAQLFCPAPPVSRPSSHGRRSPVVAIASHRPHQRLPHPESSRKRIQRLWRRPLAIRLKKTWK